MMNQLIIHDTLSQCAMQCHAFAYDCCCSAETCSESVVLSIDCAELCRQASVLYRSDSAQVKAVAGQCIRACESLVRQLTGHGETFTLTLLDSCRRAQRCCQDILAHAPVHDQATIMKPATVCYGISLSAGVYQG